jgi:glutamine synthetase
VTDLEALKQRIEAEDIEFVDLRVSDVSGRFRHISVPSDRFDDRLLDDGIGFDGSNYGYCAVARSDMRLVPDLTTAYAEERDGERILTLICDVYEASSQAPVEQDPRRIAAAAVRYAQDLGLADEVLVSPEFEFYVFDDVRYESGAGRNNVEIKSVEGCDHSESPQVGHSAISAYHAPLPEDRLFSLRCEICRQISEAGIPVKYHHHEVGSFGQQEIELGFASLLEMADATQIVKSIVRNVAAEAGVTATFLPKPIFNEAGNGLHLHQFLAKAGVNLFRDDSNGLSELALCYIGGLLTHGGSLMGLTNPSTNSYRRLVPGHEAPVRFVFGAANRSAAVRVPAYAREDATRIELRTMDATCNPYLAFAGILLAGIDGVKRNLNATELGLGPCEQDVYKNEGGEPAPRRLGAALEALAKDYDYLVVDGAFTKDLLDAWIRARQNDADEVAARPHPHEFSLYYDL